ncbi:MAG: hypothetical protein LAQ69_04970 [Acidobacteriia bacterium]|nr:hypothetical protein [Terriglobia bacterium]
MRTTDDKEVRLGSYEMFHRGESLTESVWEKLILGLSTRKYGQAVREFTEAYGLEKSAVSEHFIEASRAKLKDLMERRFQRARDEIFHDSGVRGLSTRANPRRAGRRFHRFPSAATKRNFASVAFRRVNAHSGHRQRPESDVSAPVHPAG